MLQGRATHTAAAGAGANPFPHLVGASHGARHVAAHGDALCLGRRHDLRVCAREVGGWAVLRREGDSGTWRRLSSESKQAPLICCTHTLTLSKPRRLSSTEQLRLRRLKASEAAVKMATSRAPAFIAFSKPWRRGEEEGRERLKRGSRGGFSSGRVQGGQGKQKAPPPSSYPHVGCEHGVAGAGVLPDAGQHIGRIRQLGHPLGRDLQG